MRKRYDVGVMHDFFVDRLVHSGGVSKLFGVAAAKERNGGGSVHGVQQEDVRGGNAVNLAHALARLGARVLLITHSDEEHAKILTETFRGLPAEVRIKPLPPGLTVALEAGVNVMLSDSGGAGKFPPSQLDGRDWQALGQSKVVCSVNWAANRHGTQLLLALRRRVGGRSQLFLNTADVRDRFGEYRRLVALMREKRVVDWMSMNEYEAASCMRALGRHDANSRSACLQIAKELGVKVDVHTEDEVYTSSGTGVVMRKTRHVIPRRLTGAGDVWDAASIMGFLGGMTDGARLEFANTAARLYVGGDRVLPPSLRDVKRAMGGSLLEHP